MKKLSNLLLLAIGITFFLISLFLDRNAQYLISLIKNNLIKNNLFDIIFGWFTNFINVFVIFILITTLFLWGEKKREWIFPLWLSFLISIILSYIIKIIILRPRPIEISQILTGLNYSFPSLHAAVSFAALPILNNEFSKLKFFWVLFAFLVAFSRLYFNLHFLSDVIFGAFLGYFIGVFVVRIEEKYRPFKFLK